MPVSTPRTLAKIDGPVKGSLVRADHDQMLLVNEKTLIGPKKSLGKLIGRREVVKASQRFGVLDPGIMGIEGDEILDSHAAEFLNGVSAVQRLPAVSLVLPAFIEEGHDYIDTVGFTIGSHDDSF